MARYTAPCQNEVGRICQSACARLRQRAFVGEDAIEGRAADGELARGAKLVAVVKVEDVLDVMANDGVEGEVAGARGRMRAEAGIGLGVEEGLRAFGERQVGGTDDAVIGFEQGVFEYARKLAHVSGPAMLEEASEDAGAEDDGALLVAGADAVE